MDFILIKMKQYFALRKAGEEHFDNGNLAEAEKLFRAALQEAEDLGADIYCLGMALNDLATLLYLQRRKAEADPLYRRAISVLENQEPIQKNPSAWGDLFPTVLSNYRRLLESDGRVKEAREIREREDHMRAR